MGEALAAIFAFRQLAIDTMAGLSSGLLTPQATLALPFILPLLLAISARSLADVLAVIAMAVAAAMLFAAPSAGVTELALYAGLFVVALLLAVAAQSMRRGILSLRAHRASLEARIAAADRELEKERFWRRAGGDGRPSIPDDEILQLAQRAKVNEAAPDNAKADARSDAA